MYNITTSSLTFIQHVLLSFSRVWRVDEMIDRALYGIHCRFPPPFAMPAIDGMLHSKFCCPVFGYFRNFGRIFFSFRVCSFNFWPGTRGSMQRI